MKTKRGVNKTFMGVVLTLMVLGSFALSWKALSAKIGVPAL